MKKIFLTVATFLLVAKTFAQAPEKMSYQAVVRNSGNALVTSAPVGMRISILQGSATGTSVYTETQSATTNNNGLVTLEIGTGTVVSGTFASIDWSAGPYFIKTETDPTGGTTYTITGTTQLVSTPYALHAKSAETVINNDDADADPTNELQSWSSLPGIPADILDGDQVDDADADPANEIELPTGGNNGQVLSTDGTGNYTWTDQTLNNLPNGTTTGQTAYWDGTAWVLNTNLYNNGGNIGIGSTNPTSAKLVISGTPGATGLDLSSTDQYANMRVLRNPNGDNDMYFGLGSGVTSKLHFYTNELEKLTLNNGVGINNTSPTEALDVTGNIRVSGALMPNNSAGTAGQVLTSAGAGIAPTWTTPTSGVSGSGNTNYHTKWTGAGTIGNSMIQDNGTSASLNYPIQANSQFFVYRQQVTATGDGQSTIYGYRDRNSQNVGASYGQNGSNTGVTGMSFWGDDYSFGVGGWNYNDFSRTGGVIGGEIYGNYWGALGYKSSSTVTFGVYGSNAFGSGTGFLPTSEMIGIGGGFFGGIVGSTSHGEIIGQINSGELFATYNSGNTYTTGKNVELVGAEGAEKTPVYAVTSVDATIYSKGNIQLVNGTAYVAFDNNYKNLLGETPVVTVSPNGNCNGLYIASVDKNGFTVKELNNGTNTVAISWIAVGNRIDNRMEEATRIVSASNFDRNVEQVLFNDGNTDGKATAIWWDGEKIQFGTLPEHLSKVVRKETDRK